MRPTLIIGLAVGAGIIIGSAIMTVSGGVSSARELFASMSRSDFANACVAELRGYMKSPSSFHVLKVEENTSPKAEDLTIAGSIDYEAKNSFGTLLTNRAWCHGADGVIVRLVINDKIIPSARRY